MEQIIKFLQDDEGLTTVEYAVAGSLVSAAVATAFTSLGAQIGVAIVGIATNIGA